MPMDTSPSRSERFMFDLELELVMGQRKTTRVLGAYRNTDYERRGFVSARKPDGELFGREGMIALTLRI
ncbi:uncharacterized protein RCO7_10446 [Rhynchosporium graminicola]|uniref:Uncharacterized protein n=1 Tax=Rhynchosporium graminicola TaxID=2792576 RepID=A0A1E1LNZ2_9HELO|nr:uncharacterized protein RCO7_10446 [Rhynchosporium commune]